MGKANKFIVILRIFAKSAHGNGHSVLKLSFRVNLRTVGLFKIVKELLGSAGKLKTLCLAGIFLPRLFNFLDGGFLFEGDKNGGKVTVGNGHAYALSRKSGLH